MSEDIERAAWEICARFNQDKHWSFPDCTSRVVMERVGLRQVFACDHHFEQMGCVRYPIQGT